MRRAPPKSRHSRGQWLTIMATFVALTVPTPGQAEGRRLLCAGNGNDVVPKRPGALAAAVTRSCLWSCVFGGRCIHSGGCGRAFRCGANDSPRPATPSQLPSLLRPIGSTMTAPSLRPDLPAAPPALDARHPFAAPPAPRLALVGATPRAVLRAKPPLRVPPSAAVQAASFLLSVTTLLPHPPPPPPPAGWLFPPCPSPRSFASNPITRRSPPVPPGAHCLPR